MTRTDQQHRDQPTFDFDAPSESPMYATAEGKCERCTMYLDYDTTDTTDTVCGYCRAELMTIEWHGGPLLYILRSHVGESSKITRFDLLLQYRQHVPTATDGSMRADIETLRDKPEGARVCSSNKPGGGYFLAADDEELRAYLAKDWKRIRTMAARCKRQWDNAGFGDEQLELF